MRPNGAAHFPFIFSAVIDSLSELIWSEINATSCPCNSFIVALYEFQFLKEMCWAKLCSFFMLYAFYASYEIRDSCSLKKLNLKKECTA